MSSTSRLRCEVDLLAGVGGEVVQPVGAVGEPHVLEVAPPQRALPRMRQNRSRCGARRPLSRWSTRLRPSSG